MISQVEVTVDGVEKTAKYGREYSDLIVADSWDSMLWAVENSESMR